MLALPTNAEPQAGVHSLGALFVLSYIADSHQLRARGLISWDTFWPSLVMPSINAACCVSRVAAVLMDHWSWRSTWVNELAWWVLCMLEQIVHIASQLFCGMAVSSAVDGTAPCQPRLLATLPEETCIHR